MGEVLMKFWIGKQDEVECTFMENLDVRKKDNVEFMLNE
jgi:hypothetical protein